MSDTFDYDKLVFERRTPIQLDRRVSLIQLVLRHKGYYSGAIDALFGDRTHQAVYSFQRDNGLNPTGRVDRETGQHLDLPYWTPAVEMTLNEPYRDPDKFPPDTVFKFTTLVPGCFYSYWAHRGYSSRRPLSRRALRTNNPGAVNISRWQKEKMKGYVGRTRPDNSSNANKTTIYSSPEYGIAMWGFLLRVRYYRGRTEKVTVRQIIDDYRGGNPAGPYLAGYRKFSNGVLTPGYEVDLYDNKELQRLAIAAYSYEFGMWFPLTDEQFSVGFKMTDVYVDEWRAERRTPAFLAGIDDSWSDVFDMRTGSVVSQSEIIESESQDEDQSFDPAFEPSVINAELASDSMAPFESDSFPEDAAEAVSVNQAALRASSTRAVDTQLSAGDGLYGYFEASARWGTASTVRAMQEVSRIWSRRRNGPRIGVGDISLRGGGAIPGHKSHKTGKDVDLRPVRNDGIEGPITWRNSRYSHDLTQELIDLIYSNGVVQVRVIGFNDPRCIGCVRWGGHDNHLHVSFHFEDQRPGFQVVSLGVNNSPAVREVQRRINNWLEQSGRSDFLTIDGDFGERTYNAVVSFQSKQGLDDDGVVGKNTWQATLAYIV